MRFTCAARTDRGVVRPVNEDSYGMLADRGVFIVADGMGGHAGGAVASDLAVRTLAREIGSVGDLSVAEASARMRAAIQAANDAIHAEACSGDVRRRMGTTVTALVVMRGVYLIGQVGDSRAYLFRNGGLCQLTRDHSLVQEQVDAGLLAPHQARSHPFRNVITRCVGVSEEVAPDIYRGSLQRGDILLLSSDGITGMLEEEHLIRILSSEGGPGCWTEGLIAEANRRGGLDNVTAIVIQIDSVASTTSDQPGDAFADPVSDNATVFITSGGVRGYC